ncbi:hypothetical protein [Streptomyces griseofuscus]|uniref:hypothetical protein n=1 Tax=Streptomyces griseofuscus TaxID=146922 RepID=UPI003453C338
MRRAGLAALLSVGVLLLAGASVSAVFLLRKEHRTTAVGTLAGSALPLFYLVYSNRGDAGTEPRTPGLSRKVFRNAKGTRGR